MANRLNNLIVCFTGCLVAGLFGLLMLIKFEAPLFAMIAAGLFPAVACRISGVKNKKQLAKIAAYGLIGWTLASMLQPVICQSSISRAARIVNLPLFGHEWHIFASFVSTLLALVGAYFVSTDDKIQNFDKSIG